MRIGRRSLLHGLAATLATAGLTACNTHPISRALTRYGYIGKDGKTVIGPRFEAAGDFSEGLAAARLDDLWGYISPAGHWVIAPHFLLARPFHDGQAMVKVAEGNYTYIDTKGVVMPRRVLRLSIDGRDFSDGLAAVYMEATEPLPCLNRILQDVRAKPEPPYVRTEFCGRWGYVGRDGEPVIAAQFIEAYPFREGRAAVRVHDPAESQQARWRFAYIDRSGQPVIAPRFDQAFEFSEGVARVAVEGRWRFVRPDGQWLGTLEFDDADDFHGGLAAVKQGSLWGYLGRDGQPMLPPRWVWAKRFSQGLAQASTGGKLGGYIDTEGRMVIAEAFEITWPFSDGLARVKFADPRLGWAYIDRQGHPVITRQVKQGWPFREGLALIGDGGLL